jgi:hypothetical protein
MCFGSILTFAVSLEHILLIGVSIKVFQERTEMLAGITIMTLVVHVILLPIEIATGLLFVGLGVTTDDATTIPQVCLLLGKQGKSVTNYVQVFRVNKIGHRVSSCLGRYTMTPYLSSFSGAEYQIYL